MTRYSNDRALASFAADVHLAAASVPTFERFGDDLVFISDVWDAFPCWSLSRERFDELLVAASCAGLVWLRRADLVQEMPEGKVRSSRVERDGVVRHFVVLPEGR